MRIQRRKNTEITRLNLIPILDAIFIFIFFLLMSAQFIDIYELNTDAPITSTSSDPKMKPLNLTITLNRNKLLVTTGLDNKQLGVFKEDELEKFNNALIKLKIDNPKETSAILRPSSSFPYHKIIKVIDFTREVQKKDQFITAVNKRNEKYTTNKLFDQIIFETME